MSADVRLRLAPRLSPAGRLGLVEAPEAPELDATLAQGLRAAFERSAGEGLRHLGVVEATRVLPAALAFWRDFAARQVTALRTLGAEGTRGWELPAPVLEPEAAEALAASVPPMLGGEYVSGERLRSLWGELDAALRSDLGASGQELGEYLHARNPVWNLVGRVHFHLAENRKDPAAPFAFLATYTTKLAAHGGAQHVPLGRALEEYAGSSRREALLALLSPVQRAAQQCPWLASLVADGEVFHPLRWSAAEAARLLADVPRLEAAGIVLRMPAGWARGRPSRPRVTARVGQGPPSLLGAAGLMDFEVSVTLEGEPLTPAEIEDLLAQTGGLALLRGRWVEIDRERLGAQLERLRKIERLAARNGLTFAEAARLLAGADVGAQEDAEELSPEWAQVIAGDWLGKALRGLRGPESLDALRIGSELKGTLRPYQDVGVRWLRLLSGLGLGACLADDMGLGKTLQVLALLLVRRRERKGAAVPSLLVAPASLLANWQAEIERFAPGLRALVAHASALPVADLASLTAERLARLDLVITSYGQLKRLPWLATTTWDLLVLDEAQAIKNPTAQQTRAAKSLHAAARIALTGTPIENRLGDLWSLFDFLNPGLLGSAKQFGAFTKRLAERTHEAYAPLRELVRPYILRRLKTDRSVIRDLPEKTEVRAWCALSKRQVVLYQQAVDDLRRALEDQDAQGIERRGVVLASLMRFKQICNHPSQWLGDGAWAEAESGKFARLREVMEVVASRQEKALIFTQFRETTQPLAAFLGGIFGRPGLVLDGSTPVAKRRDLVRRFQEDDATSFFVLSLKAGGSGLNLTAASHVVHFDRWWNPAVENQATDRAFRIGQKRNVLVHKLICKGTVEESIDELIEQKRGLVQGVLEGGGELLLTELPDEELLRLVSLDVKRAAVEV